MRTLARAHTVSHHPDVTALTVSIAPAIASSFAAIVVAYVAWQQWRTARHKLAVDLFDRRLAAYRALNNAIGARHNEILALTFEQVTRDPPTAALGEFWAAKSDAYFLFGPRFHQAAERVEDRLRSLLEAKTTFMMDRNAHPSEYVAVIKASANVFGAQDKLLGATKPYMMMGSVGAAKSLRWRREELGAGTELAGPKVNQDLIKGLAFGSKRLPEEE